MGANDEAFGCMGAKEDEAGLPGVFLQTCVVKVAGLALARNLKRLGNLVLPLTEKVRPVRRARCLSSPALIPAALCCLEVASLALVRNLKRLGNLVLPLTEKVRPGRPASCLLSPGLRAGLRRWPAASSN